MVLEVRDSVAILRLNRPDVHNVVNVEVMERLEEVVEEIEAGDSRVVVVTGTGKSFCAGGDLSYFTDLSDRGDGEIMSRRMQAILRRLEDGPRPVIGALNGPVLGGGCEIALACHVRIASPSVRFSFRPAALGVITGWGGGLRLFRQIGRGAALRLLLGAENVEADEALELGLVDRVVETDLMDQALAWAEQIASNVPASIRAILELDRAIRGGAPVEEIIDTETRLFGELWDGPDFKRSLADWQSRRQARQRV